MTLNPVRCRCRLALLVSTMLVTVSCGGGAPSFPTQGLVPEQVRAVRFLDGREVVLDLRLRESDGPRGSAGPEAETFEVGDGWFVAENQGRWAVGDRSTLSVYVTDPVGLHLYVESQGSEVEAVHVALNDVEVGTMVPGDAWGSYSFRLEPGALRAGANEMAFSFEFPVDRPPFQTLSGDPATIVGEMFGSQQPSAARLEATLPRIREAFPGARVHGNDILNLPGIDVADVIGNLDDDGIGTAWQWVSVGGGALAAGFRTIALVEEPETFEPEARSAGFSRIRGDVSIERSGRLFVPLDANGPHGRLTLAASTPGGFGRSTDLRFSILAEGDEVVLAETVLGKLWGTASYGAEFDLGTTYGPSCLVVDVEMSPASEPLSLDVVDLAPSPAEPTLRPAVVESPDIVLIVLDAARADHFSCYGYERNTSPNIDALAAEGLVFENAFATAPYTSCSMPTMVTGLSFRDHGVLTQNQVLDESITTLAEVLQDAGYRTSCYSANPNNALGRGTGQGCELFEELWRNSRPEVAIDPYRVSASGLARLAEGSEQPEFMMLHYVPPHEPYAPAAGFDIFGDPAYDGAYDGTRETVLGIDTGQLDPTPADMAEVVSLYDGNLLTGDDAVGQVLEALKARDRWDNTVVLVVSDHGEAFGEHGRMSHNNTVYDEMLRVPFVLRLPGGRVPDFVDTQGLVSLEDVVPTLLGLAGIVPPRPLSGVDLLASRSPRKRGVVARSAHDPPLLGYRTSRWKLVTGRGVNELYDVDRDPGEMRNLVETFEEGSLETSMCLRSLLDVELYRPSLGAAAGEGVELSEDDVETLRSLGYIR